MGNSPPTGTALRRLGRSILLPREKPASSSNLTLIIVATLIGVIVAATIGVLFYLHLRRRRIDRSEDARAHELSDYDNDGEDVMPRPNIKTPNGAVVTGTNGWPAGGGRPWNGDMAAHTGADQSGSSVETIGAPPPQKSFGDPFADGFAGGGRG